ncbi:zinc finger protein 585A isoform X2 [Thunnus maccoyii]|uniref:zinc finger protein 585A isoform X1 n=1 Tax=Thunnus maccoyii TaxID=8240 RepID=UPI001C4B01F2|nr:zinc finger protein 585A isoform X1 [Thunnus maccoyii]XP_042279373.1 zinc finger protein 585A isoform X2 [Thunnus maccoyii]
MSEDSSSDDEWCVFTKRQMGNAHLQAKCWECGKKFRNIANLISHYKSHDIKATCHICKVTFRRLTSLSTHLDNAHSPPLCRKCHQSFSNVWELNKHAETLCMGSAPFQEAPSLTSAVICQSQNSDSLANKVTAQQSADSVLRDSESESMRRDRFEMRPATSENSVEYIVGEDDKDIESPHETGWEEEDDSTSSYTDDENETRSEPADMCSDDPESDGDSNSCATDCSSDSSNSPHSKKTPATLHNVDSSVCSACGRGPFRSLKVHLLHCSGIRVKYQCSLCKMLFPTETSLNQHYMPLYSCDICGQVFSLDHSYNQHQCPKGGNSPTIFFCTESMPKVCNICRSFFTSEKTLLNHVARVHTSVSSTKLSIITNPSALTNKKLSPGVSGTAARSATSSSGHVLVSSSATCQSPSAVKQVVNGKLSVGQNYAGTLSTVVKSSPSCLSTSSFHKGRPPAPTCMTSAAGPVRSGHPTNQPSRLSAPLFFPPSATDTTPVTPVSHPVSPPIPTIMAMFENDSQEVALMKRMSTGWRSKAPYPCRQCGAVLRQPSFIISHRYLHRGRRSHRCQCGRAFKHRLHLLRHCVQHAEAMSYICVNCGESFTGAKLLAEHMKGKSQKKSSSSGHTWKRRVKRKCKMPFTCDCGQLFFRPSAYIWHQLKNKTKTKQWKKVALMSTGWRSKAHKQRV